MSDMIATRSEIESSSGVNPLKCMRCGKCSATCPAYNEMEYHPHQFVYMVERNMIDELASSPSIYKCLSCFACIDRCPRQVEPAKLIEAIRLRYESRPGYTHIPPQDIPSKITDDMPQQAIVSATRKYTR